MKSCAVHTPKPNHVGLDEGDDEDDEDDRKDDAGVGGRASARRVSFPLDGSGGRASARRVSFPLDGFGSPSFVSVQPVWSCVLRPKIRSASGRVNCDGGDTSSSSRNNPQSNSGEIRWIPVPANRTKNKTTRPPEQYDMHPQWTKNMTLARYPKTATPAQARLKT